MTLSLAIAAVTISEAMQYRQARAWAPELFLLEEIRVTGAGRFTADEILGAVDLTRGETDMADVNAAQVRADIAVAFPDFRAVIVTRDVPAGRLLIDVVERNPVARVRSGGVTHVVDEIGKILARPFAPSADPSAASASADGLPLIAVATPASESGTFDGPELFRALRLMAVYADNAALRQGGAQEPHIDAIDAQDPDRIAVDLVDGTGVRRAAILSEQTMAAGLRNVLLVAERRRHSTSFAVVSSSGERDETTPAAPRVEGDGAIEIIDARFASTVYVKTIPGGQDG